MRCCRPGFTDEVLGNRRVQGRIFRRPAAKQTRVEEGRS
jgi:hypothetical protein